jgi:hypothetical protein
MIVLARTILKNYITDDSGLQTLIILLAEDLILLKHRAEFFIVCHEETDYIISIHKFCYYCSKTK